MNSLPPELIFKVLSYTGDAGTALALMHASRGIRDYFDPTTTAGELFWSRGRRSEDWPDPAEVGLSDYVFLRRLYSLGCNSCDKNPKCRKNYWAFGGRRFCGPCWHMLTIRSYMIQVPQEWYEHLPSYRIIGGYNRTSWDYRIYLESDIPTKKPRSRDIDYYEIISKNHRSFSGVVESNRLSMKRKQDILDLEVQGSRRRQIDRLINESDLDAEKARMLPAYSSARRLRTPFTSRARKTFVTKLGKEYKAHYS